MRSDVIVDRYRDDIGCDEMEPVNVSLFGEEQSRLTNAPQTKSCQYSKDFFGGTSFVECVIVAMTVDTALI